MIAWRGQPDDPDPPTRTVVRDGVLTVTRLDTGATFSLPWPPPPLPAGRLGAWLPATLARHPDGSATGLWYWEDWVAGRADAPRGPEEPREDADAVRG